MFRVKEQYLVPILFAAVGFFLGIKYAARSNDEQLELALEQNEVHALRNRVLSGSDASIDSLVALNRTFFRVELDIHGKKEIAVPFCEYIRFKRLSHVCHDKDIIHKFLTPNNYIIETLAGYFTGSTPEEKAAEVVYFIESNFSFPQKRDSSLDKSSIETVRYPVESLVDRYVDCIDRCTLAGTLLKRWGVPFIMLNYPKHFAMGIAGNFSGDCFDVDGKRYYFAELTGNADCHIPIGQQTETTKGLQPEIITPYFFDKSEKKLP